MFLFRSYHKAINNVRCERITMRVLRLLSDLNMSVFKLGPSLRALQKHFENDLIACTNPEERGFCEVKRHGSLCSHRFCKAEEEDCFSKENLLRSLNYDMAAKKRKKDLMNNNSKVPCESKTRCWDDCVHISEDRTPAKPIYQTWALHQESMRTLCNTD